MTKQKSTRFQRNLSWAQKIYASNKDLNYERFADHVQLTKRATNDSFLKLLDILANSTSEQKRAAGKARWAFKVKTTLIFFDCLPRIRFRVFLCRDVIAAIATKTTGDDAKLKQANTQTETTKKLKETTKLPPATKQP